MWSRFASILSLLTAFAIHATADLDDIARERQSAKPWLNQSIVVQGVNLWVTPTTLLVGFVTIFYLYYAVILMAPKPSHVIASHILLTDHSDKAKEKLEDIKEKIGTDFDMFSSMAYVISACPSKSKGGNLGRFKPGVMVPPFDRAVFDETNPIRTTLGPIQTQFGWHLIYIHDRYIAPKK
jgi:peptidyl-prolyl cis-trans isomerase C